MGNFDIVSEQQCFNGTQGFYAHQSDTCGGTMRLAVFQPPQIAHGPVPVVTYLAGLTCTEETFMIKAGAQRIAAELGLMLVAPDTSPRGAGIDGEEASWDLGTGAGFYLDATQSPWSRHYNMYSYVIGDLQQVIAEHFPANMDRQGIFGHSMGGHGALTIHLKNPQLYKSVSAFAPIAAPMDCPWGQKVFSHYLGPDQETWKPYDARHLVLSHPSEAVLFIDQGMDDPFLEEQLHPHMLESACNISGQKIHLRRQAGYDHSYYFVQSFVEDHLRHHHAMLSAE